MGGLIEGAKQKIWSISNQIVAGKPTPNLKVGLLAYRDRGDAYVTKLTELTDDLDAIYADIKEFKADRGGDTPESVNQALHEAVTQVQVVRRQGARCESSSWSATRRRTWTTRTTSNTRRRASWPARRASSSTRSSAARTPRAQGLAGDRGRRPSGAYVQIAQDGATVRVLTPLRQASRRDQRRAGKQHARLRQQGKARKRSRVPAEGRSTAPRPTRRSPAIPRGQHRS